jgi:capsular polysaccharide transport system permease protein
MPPRAPKRNLELFVGENALQNAPAQAATKPIPLPPRKPGQGPKAVPAGKPAPVAKPAGAARRKPRHSGLIVSFLALVVLPTIISGAYLGFFAVDQYTSTVGFAVKSEKSSASIDLMGGISQLTGGSSTDASMVAAYLQSQDLVAKLDSELNLRALFSKPFKGDPVFAFDPSGSIEDLVYYWNHMVTVSFDSGTGLIEMDVQAFTPQSAQAITQAAFKESARVTIQPLCGGGDRIAGKSTT